MKYIKTYEIKQSFFVSMIKKDDIRGLTILTNELKQKKISFKVYDSGKRNQKYYYLITKKSFTSNGNVNYNDNDLSEYGEEVDYEFIINTNKYNL